MRNILPQGGAKSTARAPTVQTVAKAAAFAGALGLTVAVVTPPAFADSCAKIIGTIDSTKVTRADAETQQKALREQIDKLDKGSQAYQQKLQSGDCRPEGAAGNDKDDKRPSCKALLQMVLSVGKLRESVERQIDALKKMAADSDGDQDKLVKMAKADGCPPYGSKPKSAEVEKPAPKAERKAAHHPSHRRHVRVQRHHVRRRQLRAKQYPERQRYDQHGGGGMVIHFGGGGIGIGF